jgi:DNA-binding NarL/FixJ family response regulator
MTVRNGTASRDDSAGEGRHSVCLFWLHPLVRSEVERALTRSPYELLACRLDPKFDARQMAIPTAEIYVVDGSIPRIASESLVAAIITRYPSSRVIVLAEAFDEASAFPLLRLGVKGVVTYAEIPDQLSGALREVGEGGFWVPRQLLSRFIETSLTRSFSRPLPAAALNPSGLTARELEVLNDLLENFSNKEIAKRLHVSERTAKFHVSNVLSKYGVRRRADLILLSYTIDKRN